MEDGVEDDEDDSEEDEGEDEGDVGYPLAVTREEFSKASILDSQISTIREAWP